jgi:hypothetical protein
LQQRRGRLGRRRLRAEDVGFRTNALGAYRCNISDVLMKHVRITILYNKIEILLPIKKYHYRLETKQNQEKKKKDFTITRPNSKMSKLCTTLF